MSTTWDTISEIDNQLSSKQTEFTTRMISMTSRAQKLLAHRSPKNLRELCDAADSLEEIFNDYCQSHSIEAFSAIQVYDCICSVDFKELHPELAPLPEEILAIMALSLIATAHMITTISSSLQKELYQDGLIEGLLASIGDQAIQKKQISLLKDHLIPAGIQAGQLSSSSLELLFSASDLLLMAEKLSGEDSSLPEDYSSFKSSLKAKMAVKVRHDKVQAIKDQFIEHYHQALESGEKTTKTSIAIKFYHSLTTEQQVKLAPSRIEGNAVRTLTNALRKFEKSKIR